MTIVWNEGALQELLNGPSGPVARDLGRRAVAVESEMKRLVNESFPPASTPGESPHKRTGRLQTSIAWRLGEDAQGLYAQIGSSVEYAIYLEQGTDQMAARPFMKRALENLGYRVVPVT